MLIELAQNAPPPGSGAAGAGIFGLFFSLWCCGISLGIGQFVMALIALIQVLSRTMPTNDKLLWGLISWFIPLVGPILWWSIGSKQTQSRPQPPQPWQPPGPSPPTV